MARRAPYCRYCYTQGHTKASCPSKKKFIEDNPHSWLAENAKRKCSYCHNKGHTRPKCPDFQEKIRQKRIHVLELRQKICDYLSEIGISPGALVKTEVWSYAQGNGTWIIVPAIVKGIMWEKISSANDDYIQVLIPSLSEERAIRFPQNYELSHHYSSTKIISPTNLEHSKKYNLKRMRETDELVLKNIKK